MLRIKRNVWPCEKGRAHVYCDPAIHLLSERQGVVNRFHTNHRFVGQPLAAHIAHEAACAVAAMLYLAAIVVVNRVFKVKLRRRRGPHRQNLIRTHAKMAIP